jgi:hypothetical protein
VSGATEPIEPCRRLAVNNRAGAHRDSGSRFAARASVMTIQPVRAVVDCGPTGGGQGGCVETRGGPLQQCLKRLS